MRQLYLDEECLMAELDSIGWDLCLILGAAAVVQINDYVRVLGRTVFV